MTTSKPQNVDTYIAYSAEEARPILQELRELIKSTIPEVEESISWNVPFYRYHGALAGLATYKNHVSFGTGGSMLQSDHRETLEENGYKTGKKTVQIRFDQKVPVAVITQILTAQAALNEAPKAADR